MKNLSHTREPLITIILLLLPELAHFPRQINSPLFHSLQPARARMQQTMYPFPLSLTSPQSRLLLPMTTAVVAFSTKRSAAIAAVVVAALSWKRERRRLITHIYAYDIRYHHQRIIYIVQRRLRLAIGHPGTQRRRGGAGCARSSG